MFKIYYSQESNQNYFRRLEKSIRKKLHGFRRYYPTILGNHNILFYYTGLFFKIFGYFPKIQLINHHSDIITIMKNYFFGIYYYLEFIIKIPKYFFDELKIFFKNNKNP
jgi:hypothetical protein